MNFFIRIFSIWRALRINRVTRDARAALRKGKNGLCALALAKAHELLSNDELVQVVKRLAKSESFVINRHPFDNMLSGYFKEEGWLAAFRNIVVYYDTTSRYSLDFGELDYDEWANLTDYMMRLEYQRRILVNRDVDILVNQANDLFDELQKMTSRGSESYGRISLLRGIVWDLSQILK